MIKAKILNRSWLLGLIIFQILPIGIILFHLYGFSHWTDAEGWITDKNSGCKYYTHHNFQQRNFIWSGECEEGFAHGSGELILFQDNKQLDAEFLDGKSVKFQAVLCAQSAEKVVNHQGHRKTHPDHAIINVLGNGRDDGFQWCIP